MAKDTGTRSTPFRTPRTIALGSGGKGPTINREVGVEGARLAESPEYDAERGAPKSIPGAGQKYTDSAEMEFGSGESTTPVKKPF
jgi:hypothetical protein